MMKYMKHYLWFVKESHSFVGGFKWSSLIKGFQHAKFMRRWEKLTPIQRENWYASGEGRTIEF
jgi:hypothetical protein